MTMERETLPDTILDFPVGLRPPGKSKIVDALPEGRMMKNALQINIMTRDCCCYVIDAWGAKSGSI
jgi:hypothetical protein